ncbi:CgeB family protein [Aurantiacibacter rhizosphaerae]|nr:glycosyltransferase [Aurantiacibacter rhizosphaerae]
MRMRALERNGIETVGFNARKFLENQSLFDRHVLARIAPHRAIGKMNEELLQAAREVRPDLVWFDKQEFVSAETLAAIKELGARLAYYTPDPYFTVTWKQTTASRDAMPLFDILVTAKAYELKHFEQVGGKVIYMPLGYCDEVHRPIKSVASAQTIDVSFIGGWEPRREEFMEAISGSGLGAYIWGYGWDHLIDGRWSIRRHLRLQRLAPNEPHRIRVSKQLSTRIYPGEIYDEAYARALSQSRISLGLLRTTWPDQHTTRTFEIPACGSLLLADRTDEHRELFEAGKEAEFFSSVEELVDKARFLTDNPDTRDRMAQAGRARCIASGYSYLERFKAILPEIRG